MSQPTKNALSVAALVVLAIAFWMLLISPKNDKADELGSQVTALQAEVASAQSAIASGKEAKANYRRNYQQLLILGKAVPADSGTASLLVQLSDLSRHSRTPFEGIELKSEGGAEEGEIQDVSELPPLGAKAGPAGLQSMPYELSFEGGFFDAANFIGSVDRLVQTKSGRVVVDGRLMTFDSFEMTPEEGSLSYKHLTLNFTTTAYAAPVGQGLVSGASAGSVAIE
jgi:Tfp pilus assembly protein PilO